MEKLTVESVGILKDKARGLLEKAVGNFVISGACFTIGALAAKGVFQNTTETWKSIGTTLCLVAGTIEAAVAGNQLQRRNNITNQIDAFEENELTM